MTQRPARCAAAASSPNVEFKFRQLCLGLAPGRNALEMRDEATGRIYHTEPLPSIATDGAGSAVRDSRDDGTPDGS